jgi:hypothetical protein
MQNTSAVQASADTVFLLPPEAYLKLCLIRDHLHFMARLFEAGGTANLEDDDLRPDAWAWWIKHVYRDVDTIMQSADWSGFPDAQERKVTQ